MGLITNTNLANYVAICSQKFLVGQMEDAALLLGGIDRSSRNNGFDVCARKEVLDTFSGLALNFYYYSSTLPALGVLNTVYHRAVESSRGVALKQIRDFPSKTNWVARLETFADFTERYFLRGEDISEGSRFGDFGDFTEEMRHLGKASDKPL